MMLSLFNYAMVLRETCMSFNRRDFMRSALVAGTGSSLGGCLSSENKVAVSIQELDKAAKEAILDVDSITSPVKIASIELLQKDGNYFVRSRSTDGAEGISISNNRASYLYPILQNLVIGNFIGKDARDLEKLIDSVYVYKSNYKMSSLALWCPVAWVEFSLLDMLGKIADKPLGEIMGGVIRREIPVYVASGNRDTTPAQEVEVLKKHIERTGVHAVKFKVGGRMRDNADSIPGRSEGLIRIVRKALGDDITIFADANGSYDADHAIEIGRLLEDYGIDMFEEPCPFDHLEETKRVADALSIPISGGEQESSHRRFRWMIENSAVQVVQPDLHYYGGYIRSTRVGRMAKAAGLTVIPHMSGEGVGYIDVLQFASFTPNMGPFQEYKGSVERSSKWYDPPLQLNNGAITVPDGPGLGNNVNRDYLKDATTIV